MNNAELVNIIRDVVARRFHVTSEDIMSPRRTVQITEARRASQIPDEVVDAICDPHNSDYEKYDDTPRFLTLETLRPILRDIAGYRGYLEMTTDELIAQIEERV